MRKIVLLGIVLFSAITAYSQRGVLKSYNFNIRPAMNETANGIWKPFKTNWYDPSADTTYYNIPRSTDSMYVSYAGWPDNGDLQVPDLEVKVKSLWYGDSIFFLLQRLDDIYVTGYTPDGQPDADVKAGLENRDASTLYFYLSADSARLSSTYSFSDSVAWLRFVWKSGDVEAKLVNGQMANSFEGFGAESVQWCSGMYCYAKIAVSISKLAAYLPGEFERQLSDVGIASVGFAVDASENDKEAGESPFEIQTRAYWPSDMGQSAMENVPSWGWIWFRKDTLMYASSVYEPKSAFASVYPNPASDFLTIAYPDNYYGSYRLVDVTGRVVLSGALLPGENAIYLSSLVPGVYYLVMDEKRGVSYTEKVIIGKGFF
ncbi:MAG: T9SS type A sorting domain-containing protein [Bacteroidales bacterium]|nr:T9SS type A sorting domain-containing protein [Bacteroidales bacterium]